MKKINSIQEINIELVNEVRKTHGLGAAYQLSSAWKEWNLKQRKRDKQNMNNLYNKIRLHLIKLGIWEDLPKIQQWHRIKDLDKKLKEGKEK